MDARAKAAQFVYQVGLNVMLDPEARQQAQAEAVFGAACDYLRNVINGEIEVETDDEVIHRTGSAVGSMVAASMNESGLPDSGDNEVALGLAEPPDGCFVRYVIDIRGAD